MSNLTLLPEWVGTAVLGAVIAALSFVAKLVVESWQKIRKAQDVRRARLVELDSLLRASQVSFKVQKEHAKRLLAMVRENHPDLQAEGQGYERTFAKAFSAFAPDEKELHSIIRSITIHSLRPTNQSLVDWLRRDTYYKTQKPSDGIPGVLAKKLAGLEAHLILWHAKYEAWIPSTPEHALVYLADEEKHGVGFPSGIDDIVAKALS